MVDHKKCKTVIYNTDNKYIKKALDGLDTRNKVLIGVGEGSNEDISYADYLIDENQTEYRMKINNRKLSVSYPGLLPKEYREVFGVSIGVYQTILKDANTTDAETYIKKSLTNNFSLPKGRGSTFKGINQSIIIDSSYNASKVAVLSFLEMVKQLKRTSHRPVVFLFGDMRELGNEAEIEHREVAKQIALSCDYIYLVGELTKKYVLPVVEQTHQNKSMWFESNIQAGEYLVQHLPKNALLLVKGSQNTIFLEESIKYLLADKADKNKLCRQDAYWLTIKSKQGRLTTV